MALSLGLATLLAGCSGTGDEPAPTVSVEAETYELSSQQGSVVSDEEASGDGALRMFANGTASRRIRLEAAKFLVVRARGDQCDGSPTLRVSIDGETVMNEPITSSEWSDYRAELDVGEGWHDVALSFVDDLTNEDCDRALVVDELRISEERVDLEEAAEGEPEDYDARIARRSSKTVFDADFSDGLTEYPYVINRNRIRVVDDPVRANRRKVLRFRVFNTDTGPTENPRAQIETPYNFREGDDRYFGLSFFFPEDFPESLPDQGWVTLGEQAYGPPFDDAAGVSLRVQNVVGEDGLELRWQRNDTYDNDIPWHGPRISEIRGRWVDVVQRIRLSSDPEEGFVELWMNTGDGWERQQLSGRERLKMKTYDSAADDGANNSRLSLYYTRDLRGPITMFHGAHKIATAGKGAFEAVDPGSYDR